MGLWNNLKLTMKFCTPLCGGSPRSDSVVEDWVKLRAPTGPAFEKLKNGIGPDARKPAELSAVEAERLATLAEIENAIAMDKVWVGFQSDDAGLFVRGANVRAHLKDCATVIGAAMRRVIPRRGGTTEEVGAESENELDCKPILNFAAKMKDATYVKEDRLRILDADGKPYREPTDYRDATQNVMTAQGPRTCLKRIDLIEPATIVATVQLFSMSEVTIKHLKACLSYGEVHGFGQDRSLQFGRYTWTLEE